MQGCFYKLWRFCFLRQVLSLVLRHQLSQVISLVVVILTTNACINSTSVTTSGLSQNFSITGYTPQQGYANASLVIQFSGTNLKSSDVVQIGGVVCSPIYSQVTSTYYPCQLPVLCTNSSGCGYSGLTASVTYNQSGQNQVLPQGFYFANAGAPTPAPPNFISVHVYNSELASLSARYVTAAGGQNVYFGFTSALTSALNQIVIGGTLTGGTDHGNGMITGATVTGGMQCVDIRPDPNGTFYYQCTVLPNSSITTGYQSMTFVYEQGTTQTVEAAVAVFSSAVSSFGADFDAFSTSCASTSSDNIAASGNSLNYWANSLASDQPCGGLVP